VRGGGQPLNFAQQLDNALRELFPSYSLQSLCDEAARIYREITGYDRVMIYRFDEDGHGELFSEQRRHDLEAFLGNHYPASDIPQIARRLYERNRVRVLVDIGYTPVPIDPLVSPATGRELDMSLCVLRSTSPIHVQYLRNMGVAATLVASIMVGGRLWGLVSCHHYVPRAASFAVRAVCELLAEALGTRIAALESFFRGQAEISVRRLEQRVIEAITRKGNLQAALFNASDTLLQAVGASGVALLFEDQVQSAGRSLERQNCVRSGAGSTPSLARPCSPPTRWARHRLSPHWRGSSVLLAVCWRRRSRPLPASISSGSARSESTRSRGAVTRMSRSL
jgi:light-regulated signal transduction histidine kinase (bacteriophytochrome)